jgi:hypothetical protein
MKQQDPEPFLAPGQEHEPHPQMTPLDAAKDFLRPYVARGDSVATLAASRLRTVDAPYAAQIGGVARDLTGRLWVLESHGLAVTRIGTARVWARFTLDDVYRQIQRDEGNEGNGERQGRLF